MTSISSSSGPLTNTWGDVAYKRVLGALHFLVVLQQPKRHPPAERYRALIALGAWVACTATILSCAYSTVLAWVAALLFQLLVVVASSFCLFVLLEYEDRSSDGADVERVTRPVLEVQVWTRWVQVVQMLLLGERWFAVLLLFPQIPLDWHLMSRTQFVPDATTLWRHAKTISWWCKVKLMYQGIVFVAQLVLMILGVIAHLVSGRY